MKKKLIIVVIICLSLFIFRDFIIRQYFISKIEYVDYDEYILIDYLNGKKNKASYVGANFMIVLEYDLEGEEVEGITKYDYSKRIQYQYNLLTDKQKQKGNNEDRPINLNNERLLGLLNKLKVKLKFKFIDNIDGRECYVLKFEFKKNNFIIVYLDKKLLYTYKVEEVFINDNKSQTEIYNYELDLELKHKDLFEEYI